MSKKFISKFLVVFLLAAIFVIAGCSDDSGDTASDDDSTGRSGEQVTLDIFQFKVEFKQQFEDLVAKYQEVNPDVKVTVQTVGGGNDYQAALKSQMSSGNEPTIFNVGGPTDIEQYREYLADLSDTEAASLALEGTLDAVIDGDEIIGLPFSQEGYGLIYNKEVFEKAGINPDELTTFEALEEAVETLDSKKEELGIEAVFALPAKEKWVMGNHLANVYIAPEFDNDVLQAVEADTVELKYNDQMKRMLDLQADYSIQPVLSLDYSQQVEQYFSLGKVAIIQQGNWVYPTIEQMDPEFAENNIGMIPMPFEGLEDHLPVGVPQYWVVNKNKSEEEIQAAKDFLDWMYTSEEGKEMVLTEFKFIPAYEGYDSSEISDPLSQIVYDYASQEKTIGWTFLGTPVGWNEDVLAVSFQKYLGGEMEWEEVVETAIEGWESIRQ